MTGKKLLLSKILFHTHLLNFLNLYMNNTLLVCNYHRLYKSYNDTNFDHGVFAHSINEFEKHVIWLKNNTTILSEDELIRIILEKEKVPKRSSLITFDDGYIDNYTLAYPVLKRYAVPAIFFIPSNQITSRQLGWWDIIAYLIKNTKKTSISYNNETIQLENHDTAIRLLQNIMKTKPHEKTINLLSKLSEQCDVPLPDNKTQSKELMTWDHIREISQNSIAIGSHTHSHRVLSTISTEEQRLEMMTSSSIIAKEIGKKVRTIAYPVGGYQHFTPVTMVLASECGYEAAFSFNTGINHANNISQFDIKRIEPPGEIELFAGMGLLPNLFL